MPLYGSSRLGEWRPRRLLDIAAQENTVTTASGEKTYELSNHLGNVLAVVSDALIDDAPSVVSATDYYAFGQEMVGRTYASEDYRYGFNGKERDSGFWGEGNAYDFGARINDPRLGRWLSLDPLMAKYPSMSPYTSMANNATATSDSDGKENIIVIGGNSHDKSPANIFNFVHQAIRQYEAYAKSQPTEKTTFVLVTAGYTECELKYIRQILDLNSKKELVTEIQSADELFNYINSGNTGNTEYSYDRQQDKVTNLDFYSHGKGSKITLDLDNTTSVTADGRETSVEKQLEITTGNINKILPDAFSSDAVINIETCRSAANSSSEVYSGDRGALAEKLSTQLPNRTVTGYIRRSDYSGTLGNKIDRLFAKCGRGSLISALKTRFTIESKVTWSIGGKKATNANRKVVVQPGGALNGVEVGSSPPLSSPNKQTYKNGTNITPEKVIK